MTARSKVKRLVRVGLVLTVLVGSGLVASQVFWEEPIVVGAVRDYLGQRRVKRHAEVLRFAAAESGMDVYLLAGVMMAESSGRVNAKSKSGALGLFQLMPINANWRAEVMGLEQPSEEELLSDPLLNARLGADTLQWLLKSYDGNLVRALCAYNTGYGTLRKLTEAAGGWDAWVEERQEAGDSQLLAYVKRVLSYRDRFRESGLLDEDEAGDSRPR